MTTTLWTLCATIRLRLSQSPQVTGYAAVTILTWRSARGHTRHLSVVNGPPKPLPYPRPERLVSSRRSFRRSGSTSSGLRTEFIEFRERNNRFRTSAASGGAVNLARGPAAPRQFGDRHLRGCGAWRSTLRGRQFTREDTLPGPRTSPSCRRSSGERFASDESAIGRVIRTMGRPHGSSDHARRLRLHVRSADLAPADADPAAPEIVAGISCTRRAVARRGQPRSARADVDRMLIPVAE